MTGRQKIAVLFVWLSSLGASFFVAEKLNGIQASGCDRGNVLRSVVFDFGTNAAETRLRSAALAKNNTDRLSDLRAAREYSHDVDRLTQVPYGRSDGTINCDEALKIVK